MLVLLCTHAVKTPAQTSAGPVLTQLSNAFSGGQTVNNVVLQGNATWQAGSLQDSGPVTLTASSSGTTQVQIALSALGVRTESESGQGSAQSCTWSKADGVSHEVSSTNCWKALLWFLPALSLQSSSMSASLGIADMGTGTIGSGTYRHLQSQLVFSDTPQSITSQVMQFSTTDLGLDPVSLLPSVLTYTLYPDSGSSTPIAIEIDYSNYTAVSGVQIPFTIQRYVNGSLQLAITLSSAQIN